MQKDYVVLGLMSGTSLDGLDMALCRFTFSGEKITWKIEEGKTISYTGEWRNKLSSAQNLSAERLAQLHHEYGVFLGTAAKNFLNSSGQKADLVSSHGHTIFHQPENGFTVQIGNGADVAAQTGLTTVCDFRSTDVALGGQGAPLVPVGDEFLFGEFDACLNIGGIANISFRKNDSRVAFDICSANIVINELVKEKNLLMDEGGKMAASGTMNQNLFQSLNSDPYYYIPDRKSFGREWVEGHVMNKIIYSNLSLEDKLRTFTEHIAFQVSEVIRKNKLEDVLITGGGAYNKFLVERIKSLSDCGVIIPEKKVIEFKEALIFALLGVLRMRNQVNTLKSVTGAGRDSCGGIIFSNAG